MNDDELRSALDRYAAAAPSTDPRPAFGQRLRRRQRRRTAAVAGIACTAALVAGAGVAVVTNDPDGVVVAADETPAPSVSPSGTPTPAATPSTRPSPSATATGEPAATASPASRPPSPSPSEPHRTPPPDVVARGEGTEGLRLTVTLRPGGVGTGSEAELLVEARDDDGEPRLMSVTWGDGTGEVIGIRSASCVSPPPTLTPAPYEPVPGSGEWRFEHAWRHEGTYTVRVSVASFHDCRDRPRREDAEVSAAIRVGEGVALSNGPAEPRGTLGSRPADDGGERRYALDTRLEDRDGYVGAATVDWGDGTTTRIGNGSACDDGGGRHYPAHGPLFDEPVHTFPRDGTYVVTVRWRSTGCDGRDPQEGTATLRITV